MDISLILSARKSHFHLVQFQNMHPTASITVVPATHDHGESRAIQVIFHNPAHSFIKTVPVWQTVWFTSTSIITEMALSSHTNEGGRKGVVWHVQVRTCEEVRHTWDSQKRRNTIRFEIVNHILFDEFWCLKSFISKGGIVREEERDPTCFFSFLNLNGWQ